MIIQNHLPKANFRQILVVFNFKDSCTIENFISLQSNRIFALLFSHRLLGCHDNRYPTQYFNTISESILMIECLYATCTTTRRKQRYVDTSIYPNLYPTLYVLKGNTVG